MAAPGASDTVIVVTGGDPVAVGHLPPLPEGAAVVAADSGIDRAQELGLRVDVAVGDFDSVSGPALAAAEHAGATVERHPEAKDATDLELALGTALRLRPKRIMVIGGNGGRLDHLLANALLLASSAFAGVEVVAQMGPARVTVVRRTAELTGVPGDLVTLLALHGRATGVTTQGLLYPLHDAELAAGSTRGVSNELIDRIATVSLRDGVLLAVQPGSTGTHLGRIQP
jgi:thiamine pyrophosphokinase